MTSVRSLAALIIAVGTCLLVGVSASLVTATSVREWYPHIEKPTWTPPDSAFGPVWSLLYLLMGVAAYLVWRDSTGVARRRALLIFALQLALNGVWSVLFFGLHSPGWAALEISLLWSAIVATLLAFGRVSRAATWLLVPYLLWVSFAAALNFAIWNLNR